ncbi:VpaChn25_0724 family phage protein [Methylobacterium iners]|uniref:Uncharacterized protein n=1 Tax=Methylobacterium iners TaxID=418707 RepID=A0ABQ4RRH1_9HYPH|nr:hypothetical protein [Methylobacterium iners]GJD93376.1 hypothetical protein OCOJLMKI_0570 [Methylobacterium iners]
MSKPDFSRHMEEDARLVILKELAAQTNYSLSDTILQKVVEAFGHNRSRDWVRTQLRKLEELGAVRNAETGSVLIATIVQPGIDHVLRRSIIEGVARPSPGV